MRAMMRLQESRVLENCTHGLMRGAELNLRPYSTGLWFRQHWLVVLFG
jgi:hypothetical protein